MIYSTCPNCPNQKRNKKEIPVAFLFVQPREEARNLVTYENWPTNNADSQAVVQNEATYCSESYQVQNGLQQLRKAYYKAILMKPL